MLAPWKKSYDQPRQHIKKQRHYFANKGPFNQSYGFSSSHVWMWELDYKESWEPNWCFWTVVLEMTLQSHLDYREIQPVHPKGNQSWIFIWRTDAEAETPILWPPDAKNWLVWKDPDAGKDWRLEEKGTTEDKVVGMASPAQWTWVWVNSWSWWWTGRPGILQSMGSQSWTRLSDWTELTVYLEVLSSEPWGLNKIVREEEVIQHTEAWVHRLLVSTPEQTGFVQKSQVEQDSLRLQSRWSYLNITSWMSPSKVSIFVSLWS